MRFIGIDYGTKRVGIAFSDESGTLAFPHSTVDTNEALSRLKTLSKDEGAITLVLGKSHDLSGKPNPVMRDIEAFKQQLEAAGLTVVYESETMTSALAARNPAGDARPIASPAAHKGTPVLLDASAAALILQTYLDKEKSNQ